MKEREAGTERAGSKRGRECRREGIKEEAGR